MSRRNSPVALPQSATSVLRRSARLVSLQNPDGHGESGKDLVLGSEPPRKSCRKLQPRVSKKLVYSSGGSIVGSSSRKCSMDVIPSLRRSLRLSSSPTTKVYEEKSPKCNSTKPASSGMKSTNVSSSCTLRRSPRFSSGGGSVVPQSSSNGSKSGNSVLSRCSTKSISSERDRSRSRVLPKTKQMYRACDAEEEEVSVCLSEKKWMRIENPNKEKNAIPKAEEGKRIRKEEERLKAKNKLDEEWTKELELALQGAYLTMKPSPNFWKKVSKMVPGKSAQECFDRVNSALITPRQPQPRSRAKKTNLSTIPQFCLSARKLLKPNSPKTKIQHRRNNLSKKTIRHLLEKQNHMDQGFGFDLFSVLEPNTTSNFLSTPMEKRQSLSIILERPSSASKDQAALISPPVLKQVKNKALHEKYIDHLHLRDAKRKAESTKLARKENIRPINIQKNDSVRTAKDSLFFDVQDAILKLKGLEAENSSSSSEFCYNNGETDEEESI